MEGKLYRSRNDSMVAGVAGGLGAYMGIDSTFVRLLFVLITVFGNGIGLAVYLLMAIVIPRVAEGEDVPVRTEAVLNNQQAGIITGGVLVLFGVYFFLDNLNLPWMQWIDFDTIWPALLIIAGVALLYRNRKGA